jgi:hypothetical protein
MIVGLQMRLRLTCEAPAARFSARKPEPLNPPGRHIAQAESLVDIRSLIATRVIGER